MAYDLKITGGTIIDGTGAPRYRGDVGIKDGAVVALGAAPEEATTTIDATGRIVSPGFVDIHTHYDAQIVWDNLVSCSPWHGVTTVVMGNCGFSVAPTPARAPRPDHADAGERRGDERRRPSGPAWATTGGSRPSPEYLDAIEGIGCAVNVAALIGHTALRMYVMGEESVARDATEEEVAAPAGHPAGGPGGRRPRFRHLEGRGPTSAYDGNPVPSRLADPAEILSIAEVLGEFPNSVLQATVGPGPFPRRVRPGSAETTGRNVSWTALLSGVPRQDYREELRKAAEIQDRGLPVYPQVAVQPVQFEMNWKAPFIYESLRCFQPVAKSDLRWPQGLLRRPGLARDLQGEGRQRWHHRRPVGQDDDLVVSERCVARGAATPRSWPTSGASTRSIS